MRKLALLFILLIIAVSAFSQGTYQVINDCNNFAFIRQALVNAEVGNGAGLVSHTIGSALFDTVLCKGVTTNSVVLVTIQSNAVNTKVTSTATFNVSAWPKQDTIVFAIGDSTGATLRGIKYYWCVMKY